MVSFKIQNTSLSGKIYNNNIMAVLSIQQLSKKGFTTCDKMFESSQNLRRKLQGFVYTKRQFQRTVNAAMMLVT